MDQKKSSLVKVKGDANRHLYRLNETYWVKIVKNGRVLRRSLGTHVLSTARLLRDDAIAKFLNLKLASNRQRKVIADLFPIFLETKATKSDATKYSMKNSWEKHLIFFDSYLPDEIDELLWIKFVEFKRSTEPDRKFFNDRKYLMMFLNWCHRSGYIAKLPKLPKVDPEIEAGRVLDKEEADNLINCSTGTIHVFIVMALTMGMRHGEIWSLEWKQIDFKKKTIFLPAEKTKIRSARKFGISDHAFELLKTLKSNSNSSWVFPHPEDDSIPCGRNVGQKPWNDLREELSIECRFHDLRHTFLTNAFKSSTNPALICDYAGLSLEEAQKTYLHFSADDTRVVSSLVKFGEKS